MTARTERAVRAVPGATSDRREGVRESNRDPGALESVAFPKRIGTDDPRSKVLIPELTLPGDPRARAGSSFLAGGRVSFATVPGCFPQIGATVRHRVSKRAPPALGAARAQLPRINHYATLYSLEYHRGALEILTYLNQEGWGTASDMREHLVPGPEAIRGALSTLVRLGLIESKHESRIPFANIYRLTGKGKVALGSPLSDLTRVLSE